jgi:carbonic anhydrase
MTRQNRGNSGAGIAHRSVGRRRFLGFAGAGALLPNLMCADEAKAPPKPGNQLSPEAALHELMDGNLRYVKGLTRRHDFNSERGRWPQDRTRMPGF